MTGSFDAASSPRWLGLLGCILVLCIADPALANKFETIGGGFSGSSGFKQEWLQRFVFIIGGACAVGALLAVVIPHNNPLYLNYNNWKPSAIIMAVLAAIFLGLGLLL